MSDNYPQNWDDIKRVPFDRCNQNCPNVKAETYLALGTIFAIGTLVASLMALPILTVWNGSWAILFRFLAKRASWRRQREN